MENNNLYISFMTEMFRERFEFVDNKITTIFTHKSDTVSTYKVKKHKNITFIELTVPLGYVQALSICGTKQINSSDSVFNIAGYTDPIKLPHVLGIRCTDDTGNEIDPLTTIQIVCYKYNPSYGVPTGVIDNVPQGLVDRLHHTLVDKVIYRDISMTKDFRYKQREEKYYLRYNGVFLMSGDRLQFNIFNPDIDIVKTELYMECNMWEKKK